VVCRGKITRRIAEVAKKAPNSFNQERLEHSEHPVSPELEYPAIATPSFSCRPGSSILIDSRFEGPLMENQAHHGTEKEYTKRGQCTYIFCTIACTNC
jgi:hypothetical protein